MEKFEVGTNGWEEVLLDLFKQKNNLVVTTKCNLNCVFCSRRYNPFRCVQHHSRFNDLKAQIILLKPNHPIYINNSISRVTDGEPFTHPRIWDILFLIRKSFPFLNLPQLQDKIHITTNGTFLTDSALKKLEKLKGIIIIHSINSTDIKDYMKLSQTSEKIAEIATSIPERIKNFNVFYIPSIVAVPNIIGYEGIKRTLIELDEQNVEYARVFLPTYTKYASKDEQEKLHCDKGELYSFISKLRKELKMKILLYPMEFKDLNAKLEGYEYLGINPSDEIISVDNTHPFSRWHAQILLMSNDRRLHLVKLKDCEGNIRKVVIHSDKIRLHSYIEKKLNEDMSYLPPIIQNISRGYKKILIVPSKMSEKVVKEAFDKLKKEFDFALDKEFYFQTAYNDFYGGSVMCAGLLMCQDYKKYIKQFIDENFKPDLVLISSASFDILGRDLLKDSIFEVMDELGVEIKIVPVSRRVV